MTRTEHLLTILAEECAEIAQRASKALRFGLDEIEPGQTFTNSARIMFEFDDLVGVVQMLMDEADLPTTSEYRSLVKIRKVEEYLTYSEKCGTLDKGPSIPCSVEACFEALRKSGHGYDIYNEKGLVVVELTATPGGQTTTVTGNPGEEAQTICRAMLAAIEATNQQAGNPSTCEAEGLSQPNVSAGEEV